MSVASDNVIFYGSADMPTADGTVTGGAVTFSTRTGFADVGTTQTVDYVSSSASDTATTITVTGRDSSGIIQTEVKTLTGQTAVAGAQSYQRLLDGLVGGTAAVGDVAVISSTAVVSGTAQAAANTSGTAGPQITLQSGQGASVAIDQIIQITNNLPSGAQYQLRRILAISGDIATVNTDWITIPTSSSTYAVHSGMLFEQLPNKVTLIRRIFYNCASSSSGALVFYGKFFLDNTNAATALTNVSVTLMSTTPALGAGETWQFGMAAGLNDTATVANRQTAPASVTFTTGSLPQTQSVPSPGNLPQGNSAAGAQAIWVQLNLPTGGAPFDGYTSWSVSGNTT